MAKLYFFYGAMNSGKTTLFNLLTGTNQKIGNWPGVTIEKKSGIIKNTAKARIIDFSLLYIFIFSTFSRSYFQYN